MKVLKYILIIPLALALLLLSWNFVASYIISPVYKFEKPRPFEGSQIFNPYQHLRGNNWVRANFHAHTRVYGGITNGAGNPKDETWKRYRDLGYDIIGISDYQSINTYGKDSAGYIPLYEHGYGLGKKHQLVLNAQRVDWFDYPVFQTTDNKQYMIKRLLKTASAVAIAHPNKSKAYSGEELSVLAGFRLVEVASTMTRSFAPWDSALTRGRALFMLCNDDCHDISKTHDIGVSYTMVNEAGQNPEQTVASLLEGRSYGVITHRPDNETMEAKIPRIRDEKILLERAELKSDTFFVALNCAVTEFGLVADGKEMPLITPDSTGKGAAIPFDANYHYMRVTAITESGAMVILNPLFRTQDGVFPDLALPVANRFWSAVNGGLTLLVGIVIIALIRRRKKIRKSITAA